MSKNYLREMSSNYNSKMESNVKKERLDNAIKQFQSILDEETKSYNDEIMTYKNNRQFITDVFYSLLDKGIRKIRELNPSDAFEYLVL